MYVYAPRKIYNTYCLMLDIVMLDMLLDIVMICNVVVKLICSVLLIVYISNTMGPFQ